MKTRFLCANVLVTSMLAAPALSQDSSEIRQGIINSCLQSISQRESVCACVADTAENRLKQHQQAFLQALIAEPTTAAAKMSTHRIEVADMQDIVLFMTSAPRACANKHK